MSAPSVSVVVPHYDDPQRLSLVLAGLDAQTLSPDTFEVIVADDGSPTPPVLGAHAYAARVVRQERDGFRAAAARNLGWRAGSGEIVCFLDGDTVPGPDYLARLLEATTDGRTLSVGRRRHVDLTGWTAADVREWFIGGRPGPPDLTDPEWLAQGYAATDDLRAADDSSFRFVISAVLAVPRRLLEETGGFEESFSSYGGEDWDLAQRCWLAGADLRHVPDAVAWHDGPDLAGREEDLAETKNRETVQLARVLTHPLVRGAGGVYEIPDLAVEITCRTWTLGQLVVVLDEVLRIGDVGVWLTDRDHSPLTDPRVRLGAVPSHVSSRCRRRLRIGDPSVPRGWHPSEAAWPGADASPEQPDQADWAWVHTRALGKARLAGGEAAWHAVGRRHLEAVEPDVVIERRRGRS